MAVDEYARPIAAALLTVTESRMKRPVGAVDSLLRITLQHPTALLRRPPGFANLLFDFAVGYRVDQTVSEERRRDFAVTTTNWEFNVYDLDEREIIAYHWHPHSVSDRKSPHFHVGSILIDTRRHDLGARFSRLHLPTGVVTIADIARMLIEEFDVVPIHRNWDETLDACQETFERQRSLA